MVQVRVAGVRRGRGRGGRSQDQEQTSQVKPIDGLTRVQADAAGPRGFIPRLAQERRRHHEWS